MWRPFSLSKSLVCERRFNENPLAVRGLTSLIFNQDDRYLQVQDRKVASISGTPHRRPLLALHCKMKLNTLYHCIHRSKHGNSGRDDISHLFVPVPVKARSDEINVGAEISGPLHKKDITKVLNRFYSSEDIKELASEHGLDDYLYQQAYMSFRRYCVESDSLPVDLHILICDIIQGAAHIHDIYPQFRKHALKTFPHLNCMEDLCHISDLSMPPNWYPDARALNRKIIFHAGPTNSGKTYHAMQQFLCAESGVYCGPLKLLAAEVFNKSNEKGTPCDLVTGEERRLASTDGSSADHVACTVEMTSVNTVYDVAVIDEIQMLRDQQRGWAWTRALLGLCAREVHVCGEECAIDLVREIALSTGEEVEVRRYKRLTPLTVENSGLESFNNIHPGDCIVCFSKRDIHYVSREIEKRGHEVAVIYGGLPPGTKLAQAYKFNDPNHPCNVLVATDAIGMGLNLSIRRVIFYSLIKPTINEMGEKEMETISVSSALQIGGRAGRYGTQWENGYVTTMKSADLPTLRRLLESKPENIEHGGLHPTSDQIELFAYHLPSYTLSNLMDIFVKLCTVDKSLYFMCIMDDFKFIADMIQHIPLQLRARYVFCCAPINKKLPFVCATYLKLVRQFSRNEQATLDWICHEIKWPFSTPKTILELVHLEEVFDVFEIYLWLSYRFSEMFPDAELVRNLQRELDDLIELGVSNITSLEKWSARVEDSEEDFIMDQKKKNFIKNKKMPRSQLPTNMEQKGMIGRGRLTDRLLAQGLLSPKMLEELRMEWQDMDKKNSDDDDLPPKPKGNRKKFK